jgi:hypothetical protein
MEWVLFSRSHFQQYQQLHFWSTQFLVDLAPSCPNFHLTVIPPTKTTLRHINSLWTTTSRYYQSRKLFYTVGYRLASNQSCPLLTTCDGINGSRFCGSMNNITFNIPTTTRSMATCWVGEYLCLKQISISHFWISRHLHPWDWHGIKSMVHGWVPSTSIPVSRYSRSLFLIPLTSTYEEEIFFLEDCITNTVNLHPSSYLDWIIDIGICGTHTAAVDTSILEFETRPFHLHGYNLYVYRRSICRTVWHIGLLHLVWTINIGINTGINTGSKHPTRLIWCIAIPALLYQFQRPVGPQGNIRTLY